MNLSRKNLKNISSEKLIIPRENIFELPEKILQFGTGMLLRALPDFFIDKANRLGIFNGRIVMIKTTAHGTTAMFDEQDGLYTLCIRGIENRTTIEENIINSSVSRVLNANHEWKKILACAHNENLQIIISNTTEVGIKLMNDNITNSPPVSYPGKLLAFLLERFIAFNGDKKSGFVIVPTELIPDNGKNLKSIVLELADVNRLDDAFITWLDGYNYFCNSLVDRIVSGTPEAEIKNKIEKKLGYNDELLTICETYSLWAIEGNDHIKKILSFAEADDRVIIKPNIDLYRELKLRLLNGTHTLSCGIAFFSGIETVKQAMKDDAMEKYISDLMQKEIAPSIPYEIDITIIQNFINNVLDRFRNPAIDHYWKNITLNYSSKMKLRCIPLLLEYYKINKSIPELFALGFAAYIYFMKAVKKNDNQFFGEWNGQFYLIEDEMAKEFHMLWQNFPVNEIVEKVLKNITLWNIDLNAIAGFQQSVTDKLYSIINNGMSATLQSIYSKKIIAQ